MNCVSVLLWRNAGQCRTENARRACTRHCHSRWPRCGGPTSRRAGSVGATCLSSGFLRAQCLLGLCAGLSRHELEEGGGGGANATAALLLLTCMPIRLQTQHAHPPTRTHAATTYTHQPTLPRPLMQLLVEIPYVLVQALLFCNICYWMVGFEANGGCAPAAAHAVHAVPQPPCGCPCPLPHGVADIACSDMPLVPCPLSLAPLAQPLAPLAPLAAGKFFLFFLLFTLTLLYFTYFGVQVGCATRVLCALWMCWWLQPPGHGTHTNASEGPAAALHSNSPAHLPRCRM